MEASLTISVTKPLRVAGSLKSQIVSLQTAHSWANAGVLLGDQGSYKKLNVKFKNIQEHFWGENTIFQEHFRHVIRTFYLQDYQQKQVAHISWCCKKCEQWLLIRKIGTPFERSMIGTLANLPRIQKLTILYP